jgi:predicted Holliday junction resolvase-like endonuclease
MNDNVLVAVIVALLAAFILMLYKYLSLQRSMQTREKEIRRDTLDRSRAVTIGKVAEHLAPIIPEFSYNLKDARFIGTPVDFIVFDGLDEGNLRRIILAEVKTGAANLTDRERKIQNAVLKKLIEFQVFRINGKGAYWEAG